MIAEGSEGVSRERNDAGLAGGFSAGGPRGDGCFGALGLAVIAFGDRAFGLHGPTVCRANFDGAPARSVDLGREWCRARVCRYGSISGIAEYLKKKKNNKRM